jgi:Ca-activated chloride channel family protein
MRMLTYRKWKSAYVCGLILCLGVFQILWSQRIEAQPIEALSEPDTQLPSVIRVSTNLVTVPVSVTDTAGHAVSNLDIGDFTLEEDGKAEVISKLAEAGQSPLQVALLFDLSGSVHPQFEFSLEAAVRFLERTWKPGDRISIISFSDKPGICLDASGSLREAMERLQRLQPTKSTTSFFDSAVLSAQLFRQSAPPETRKAAIALSDGEDNESRHSIRETAREVQRSDMIFYAINPSGASVRLNEISFKGQKNLESLAAQTGGTAFVSDHVADLDAIFGRIAAELRAQYLLSYYSSNPRLDGKFRRITVSIPRTPGLRIRARQGYYAVQK